MPAKALRSAWAKLDRAEEQIKALYAEDDAFLKSDPPPNSFVADPDMDCVEWVEVPGSALIFPVGLSISQVLGARTLITLNVVARKYRIRLVVNQERPERRWGSIVGEIVHDLRSALDYVVWELTIRNQRRLRVRIPRQPYGQWAQVQFPISEVLDADPKGRKPHVRRDWGTVSRRHLWGVDPNVWARFEKFQPHVRKRGYKRHPLWQMNATWNRDKHRTVRVSQRHGFIAGVKYRANEQVGDAARFAMEPLSIGAVRAHKDGTEVGQVVLRRTDSDWPMPAYPTVNMNTKSALAPRTYVGLGPRRENLFVTLDAYAAFVREVLIDFDKEFR